MTKSRIPKSPVFSDLDGEILINLDVAKSLNAIGVECLAKVQAFRTTDLLPLKEMRWEAVLPPFSENSTGYEREHPCPKCDRDGFFGLPKVPLCLVYDNLPPEYKNKNILATFERFGNSRLRSPFKDSVFATPLYIVSSQVADCLNNQGVKGIDFEPVAIIWA